MRKQFLLMWILCLSALTAWAERIDVATARKVAESVAQREGAADGLRSGRGLSWVYAAAPGESGSALRSGTMEGAADYFVFNFPDGKGFAIVAGDDRVHPVLGYSDEGSFDPGNLPENLRGWLAGYQEQITWAENKGIEATPDIAAEWSRYMSGAGVKAMEEPTVLPTAEWGQYDPYNRQTPNQLVTGCVATAMGIIMEYHKYPKRVANPPSSNLFYVEGKKSERTISYDDYDWENMLDVYYNVRYNDTQANAVAELLWHCGANAQMMYGAKGSAAYTLFAAKALSEVFGYRPARYLLKNAYRWEEWKNMLRDELDQGFPVLYEGNSPLPEEGAHAFVCDGYSADGAFHINWGWDGTLNGFYRLSVLDDNGNGEGYSLQQGMIINIRPEEGGEKSQAKPYAWWAEYQTAGNTVTAYFACMYMGWEENVCQVGLGIVDESNQLVKAPSSSVRLTLKGWELNDKMELTVPELNGSCTINLSDLSEGQRAVLCCSLGGSDWEIMRTGITEKTPIGIDHRGNVINPSEDVPDEPERPTNAGLYWDELAGSNRMKVTGLDNKTDSPDNTKGLCFWTNSSRVVWRYQIQDYAQWKGQIAVYRGTYKEDLSKAWKGAPVPIDENGTFDIPMDESLWVRDKSYTYHLKVLSKQEGELTYDLQALPGPDEAPVFERKGNKIKFTGKSTGPTGLMGSMDIVYDPAEIRGTVDQEIPIGVKFRNISDPALVGGDLTLDIIMNISGAKKEQIHLFDEEGKEIELSYMPNSTIFVEADNVPVGKLAEDKLYSFKLVCGTEMGGTEACHFSARTPEVNGTKVTLKGKTDADIIITPSVPVTANAEIHPDGLRVWVSNGRLYIQTPEAATAYIVTFSGRVYKTLSLSAGESSEEMPQGSYIIRIGKQSYKLKF